ncbi:MAG: hypothetical protein R3B89_06035 [Polyangiaceae bacterium]
MFRVPGIASAALGWLLVGCGSGAPPPNAPIEVAAPAEPSAQAADPPPPPAPRSFEEFLASFLERAGEPSADFVDPELGVFAVTNAGAFPHLERFKSYREVLESNLLPALSGPALACANAPWEQSDGRAPGFSCETEAYDVSGACVRGTLESERLISLVKAMTGAVFSEELGEELQQRASQSEPQVSHYAFVREHDLFLYFGRVDGNWKLLWLDARTPCSA